MSKGERSDIQIERPKEQHIKHAAKSTKNNAKEKALGVIADTLVKFGVGKNDVRKEKESFFDVPDGASQEIIPIKNIKNGLIITTDNRYIFVLEFTPIDFMQKDEQVQNDIVESFGSVFRDGPQTCSLKIISDRYSPRKFIKTIVSNCKDQNNPQRIIGLQNYISHILDLSNNSSLIKRYFFIYQYSSDPDYDNVNDFEHICSIMKEEKALYIEKFRRCGNIVIRHEDEDAALAELSYYLFNRQTSRVENLETRKIRMQQDIDTYNSVTGENKKLTYADLIAPKGLYFDNRKYVYCDGLYYGFLGLKANNFPSSAEACWTTYFNEGVNNIDVDIKFSKLPKEIASKGLKLYNREQRSTYKRKAQKSSDEDDIENARSKYNNGRELVNKLKRGDDLYNVEVILTFRQSTAKALGEQMRRYIKNYREYLQFDDAYLTNEQYFKLAVPPIAASSRIERKLKHNLTSTTIGYTYPFSGLEMNDIDGYLLGKKSNGSLAIINNFNTNKYKNPHVVILGSSGAGKTYTEETIGGRSCLNGIRVHYIIPAKGFEYKLGCKFYHGSYIQLGPGMRDCINPLDIRPEDTATIDEDIEDIDMVAKKENSKSLLAKKVNFLIVWIQLLSVKTEISQTTQNTIASIIMDLYAKIGITEDNSSIYESDGKTIKNMPIIGDLQDAMLNYTSPNTTTTDSVHKCAELLSPFTHGQYQNMNQHTNVDLSRDYTVYDVDENYIDANLLPSFIFLSFDCVYSKAKSNRSQRDLIVLDEVWKMLALNSCAGILQNAVLLARSYYISIMFATQELSSFLNSSSGYGISILNNSAMKIYMSMEPIDLKLVAEHLDISSEDQKIISKLKKGNVLEISAAEKMQIEITTTPLEFSAYNTDHSRTAL